MLSDPTKSDGFRQSSHWRSPLLNFQLRVKQETPLGLGAPDGPKWRSNSFSGHERNRFLLGGRDGFSDLSLVSGADCREDARSFAMLDFDADGWLDIALMSTQAPRFRLFRNRLGDQGPAGRVITVRLEGANHTATASAGSSARDAIGAVVTAVSNSRSRTYRRTAGEGLASQNAPIVRLTLSPGESLREIRVRWPSGRTSNHRPKPSEAEVRLSEPVGDDRKAR